jgi:hypothetical protein
VDLRSLHGHGEAFKEAAVADLTTEEIYRNNFKPTIKSHGRIKKTNCCDSLNSRTSQSR